MASPFPHQQGADRLAGPPPPTAPHHGFSLRPSLVPIRTSPSCWIHPTASWEPFSGQITNLNIEHFPAKRLCSKNKTIHQQLPQTNKGTDFSTKTVTTPEMKIFALLGLQLSQHLSPEVPPSIKTLSLSWFAPPLSASMHRAHKESPNSLQSVA